ncbi:MAG TPA: flagellin [Anaerolineales bacterium]|nr:flagellin [Anaerolineales bacterium]
MANVDVNRVAGNIGALNSLYSLRQVNQDLATRQARLQTGKRLLSAADDPAGMNIATSFDIRRNAMKTTLNAIGDAKNLMSTAEGGLTKIQDILVKMQNKALEAVGDTIGQDQRDAIVDQLNAYRTEIDDIVAQTQWNGRALLSATALGTFLTGVDSSGSVATTAQATLGTASNSTGLGLTASFAITDTASANTALGSIATALSRVKGNVSDLGAFSARLSFKEESLTVAHSNVEAAYNRIMNADMAEEQVEASKLLILQQTSSAMLAQANSAPQFLLSLFR